MSWLSWTLVGVAIVAFLAFKRLMLIAPARARQLLDGGGIVVDVRSEAEFRDGHLPRAINIPLDRLGREVDRRYPDKDRVILLHCLSGGRSGIGKGVLKRQGYRQVYNLGSFRRAEQILAGQPAARP
jgi:phage shock protein E